MTKSKITVIISVVSPLNDDALRQCLNSVRHQTYTALECIVAAPDTASDRATKLLSQDLDTRFRLCITDSSNEAGLLNAATATASGEYMMVLSSDDLLAPTCLENAMACRHEYNADYVVIDVRAFQDARSIQPAPTGQSALQDVLASPQAPVALLYRKELAGPFNERVAPLHMAAALIKLIAAELQPAHLKSPLYFWRRKRFDSSILQGSLNHFMDEHVELYRSNWKEILAAKEIQIEALTNDLAANYESLKHENEMLQSKFDQLSEKHQELEEHHARSLSSIKVTGTHLLRAIFSKAGLNRG